MFLDPRTKLLILAMTSVSVFLNKSILIECIFVSIPSILFAQARLFRPVIKNIAVFIGPEGGFEESEVERIKNSGFEVITLGKRILRTETAGLALLSNIMIRLEDE